MPGRILWLLSVKPQALRITILTLLMGKIAFGVLVISCYVTNYSKNLMALNNNKKFPIESKGQESGGGLAGLFCIKVSHEVAVKLLSRDLIPHASLQHGDWLPSALRMILERKSKKEATMALMTSNVPDVTISDVSWCHVCLLLFIKSKWQVQHALKEREFGFPLLKGGGSKNLWTYVEITELVCLPLGSTPLDALSKDSRRKYKSRQPLPAGNISPHCVPSTMIL